MSRSRPPKCPVGRHCGVCRRPDYEWMEREQLRYLARVAERDAAEYLELPHYPFLGPQS